MTEQCEPAIRRVPTEIWWVILHEVIGQYNSLFFSTTFDGSSWSEYSSRKSFDLEEFRRRCIEEQRKKIGSVCRSWQAFANSRRDLYVALKLDERGELSPEIERASNARHVGLNHSGVCRKLAISPHVIGGFNWEIVEINQRDVPELALIPLPHLRRLRMNTQRAFLPNPFLDALNKFKDITWLEYETFCLRESIPIDLRRAPIVLPNLQVLRFKTGGTFGFPLQLPFRRLALPSLRFLSLHMDGVPVQFPLTGLTDTLLPYRQTLRSFNARVNGPTKSLPPIQFVPWEDFSELEELAIDRPWTINFHPLPPKHPLRSLEAQHDSLDTMPSLLRGENMEILLQGARWADDGGLRGENEEVIMDKVGVDRLLTEAESRGVSVEVSWYGRHSPRREAPKSSSG
ncbi:hypothetical protein CPB86DRAFT_784855 [Serendipita vermifera]|nr:hypothetical protein CPB86DRAFT_784855 [Serendipita vermifera]